MFLVVGVDVEGIASLLAIKSSVNVKSVNDVAQGGVELGVESKKTAVSRSLGLLTRSFCARSGLASSRPAPLLAAPPFLHFHRNQAQRGRSRCTIDFGKLAPTRLNATNR